MPEQHLGSQLFNKAELAHLEDTLQKQYDELEKEVDKLAADLRRIEEMIKKVKMLKNGSGGPLSNIDTNDMKQTLTAILADGALPVREIRKRYFSLTGIDIERDNIFECLKENQGKIFEVVGERAKAAWRLINGHKDVTDRGGT